MFGNKKYKKAKKKALEKDKERKRFFAIKSYYDKKEFGKTGKKK